MLFRGFLPQDWLFRKAAAVIHHGGIGTTARVIRNGCPMLVEPYGNDQFFNASRVVHYQVGAAMHPNQLRVPDLARLLESKVMARETRQNSKELGKKIRAEPGLEGAVSFIDSLL